MILILTIILGGLNKMKKLYILFFAIFLLFFLMGCSNKDENNTLQNTANSSFSKISTTIENNSIENTENNISQNEIRIGVHDTSSTETKEEELASFSTKLGGTDSPRTNNISITTRIIK